MATKTLIPSSYTSSDSTYVTVTDAENMYSDTSSSTYATLTNTSASTTAYYVYIQGFNFDEIPANATVNSFTVNIKGYESLLNANASYAPRLWNGSANISNAIAPANFSTTLNTLTISNGTLTWSQMKGYGSAFGIRVTIRRANASYQGYLYIYGAEIVVDYTEPSGPTNVRVKQNGVWVTPRKLLVKQNGSWVEATKILAKDGGSWK